MLFYFALLLSQYFVISQASLLLAQLPPELGGEKIEDECLYDAVNVILSLQASRWIIFLYFFPAFGFYLFICLA